MSRGMTPQEFVKQVFYVQEGVLLDFWPSDDKYKEVLTQANLVLQEFQKEEDWGFLRERLELGPMTMKGIPEFTLPDWVYKPCTLFGDSVQLYPNDDQGMDFISVPWISTGQIYKDRINEDGTKDRRLYAIHLGDTITFNRQPIGRERQSYAYTDVQRYLEPVHICDDTCTDDHGDTPSYDPDDYRPCSKIEDKIFTEIPDPNYIVYKTASYTAIFSPPAQGRLADLKDTSQKLLSAMRQNNASTTVADVVEYAPINHISIY